MVRKKNKLKNEVYSEAKRSVKNEVYSEAKRSVKNENVQKRQLQSCQQDLGELEKYIKEFSAFLPLAVCTVNPVGTILDVNKAFEKLVKFDSLEIVGKEIENFFLEKEKLNKLQKEIIEKKEILNQEITLITKEKKEISVNASFSSREDAEGNYTGYFLGISDISELKKFQIGLEERIRERTEELIKSREALLNILSDAEEAREIAEIERDKTLTMFENFPEGLMFFNNENKTALINPQINSFFNVNKEKLIGKGIKDLEKISSLSSLVAILGEKLSPVYKKELEITENLILEISVLPIISLAGEKIGTLVLLRNITREKIVEKLKTEFVTISAHQLRTPLSAIKWTIRMLLDGDVGKLTDEQTEFLKKAYQSNERMVNLINDLLNVTRIEEGRYLYNPEELDMIELIEKTIIPLKEIAERKNLKFEFLKPKEKEIKVRVDKEKISLAISNLVDNAINYTKEGKISIQFEYDSKDKQVKFSVKDTGIGISEEQQKRLFSKFFRGINAIKAETEGTGLGLFIAKNIIEAHGGRIWFESEEGKGTTFYFTLPLKK
ncbi:hypothetical protein COS93_02660 [bacterium (Candidatus Gribaldobacteria) CG07_land_8_20_14_0_80_33_18]|uniref:histidine kinase n=1 Tax=bacterium (Candidatus Gribaldobacteria) CG07_land_8_20_14_0_80_33_18 TaxID=2014272 RepID=A0A2M6Z200_9BACT|nr:MAG: hypothetical protein COS93_02660 [bacterium (Candidatus Gribaldobacteria) CG07_land_8_20_14_0_80_33_18]